MNSYLESRYADVYQSSIIEVGTVGNWVDADLEIRSNDIHVVSNVIADAGEFLEELYHDLQKPRLVVRASLKMFLIAPLMPSFAGCFQAKEVPRLARCQRSGCRIARHFRDNRCYRIRNGDLQGARMLRLYLSAYRGCIRQVPSKAP